MRLASFRYEEIKKVIANLLEELEIRTLPINELEIAKKLNIPLVPYSAVGVEPESFDLLTKCSADGFISTGSVTKIYYNDVDNSYQRMKWTIIHEIGHSILGHKESSEVAETEADFFVGYLLAPPVLIHEFKIKTPAEIVDRFGLSLTAASYALNRYKKWLKYGNDCYTEYEMRIYSIFSLVA